MLLSHPLLDFSMHLMESHYLGDLEKVRSPSWNRSIHSASHLCNRAQGNVSAQKQATVTPGIALEQVLIVCHTSCGKQCLISRNWKILTYASRGIICAVSNRQQHLCHKANIYTEIMKYSCWKCIILWNESSNTVQYYSMINSYLLHKHSWLPFLFLGTFTYLSLRIWCSQLQRPFVLPIFVWCSGSSLDPEDMWNGK